MKIKNIFRNILLTGMSTLMATPYNVMAAGLFEEDFSVEDVLLNDNHTEELLQDDINNKEFVAENDNMVVKAIVSELEKMPDGTELIISEVEQDTIEYQSILENIKNEISKQDNSKIISNLIPIHVKFVHEGKEIENIMDDVELDIRLKAENSIINKDTVISSISKDNLVSNLENMSIEEDALRFYTKEFSTLTIFNLTESQNNDALDDLLIEDNINNTQDTEQEEKQQNDTSLDDILIENDSTQEEVTEEDSATEDILLGEEPNTESQDNNNIENEDLLFDKNQINEEENMNLSSDDALLDENHENEYVYDGEDALIETNSDGFMHVIEQRNPYNFTSDEISVTANVGGAAVFSDGTKLKVNKIEKESKEYNNALNAISENLDIQDGEIIHFLPYDIRFEYEGEEVEPKEGVVSMNMKVNTPDFIVDENTMIAHIKRNGEIEYLTNNALEEDIANGEIHFDIESFSIMGPIKVDGRSLLTINMTPNDENDDRLLAETNPKIAGTAYAILYDTGEFVFQRNNIPDSNNGAVVKTYTGFEDTRYSLIEDVPWHNERAQITSVTFKDLIQPRATDRWFEECANLLVVNNGNNLDLSSCYSLFNTFSGCRKLESIDVSNWDLSYGPNMTQTFMGCNSLKALDVSNWDVSRCGNLFSLFSDCSSLTELDVSNWDVSNCKGSVIQSGENIYIYGGLNQIFSFCQNLKKLDVSRWNVSSHKGLYSIFSGCKKLESLDVSSWNTSNCIDFTQCFSGCESLDANNIGISNWNTANGLNFFNMFSSCKKISFLDLSNFRTDKAKTMEGMFRNCINLEYLNINNFNVTNCKNFENMFFECKKLTDLNIVSSWSLENAENLRRMFYDCCNLKDLNINSFRPKANVNTDEMFYKCASLREINISNRMIFNQNVGLKGTWRNNRTGEIYNSILDLPLDSRYNGTSNYGTYSRLDEETHVMLYDSGEMVFQKGNAIDPSKGNLIEKYYWFDTINHNGKYETPGWKYGNNTYNITTIDFKDKITPTRINDWFQSFSNLISVKNCQNFDLSLVDEASRTFQNCTKLIDIDVSTWVMPQCKSVSFLFSNCKLLTKLDANNMKLSSCNDMQYMFSGCSNLETIDISSLSPQTNVNTSNMFDRCPKLKQINIGKGMKFNEQAIMKGEWKNTRTNEIYDDVSKLPFNANYNGENNYGLYIRIDNETFAILYDSGELVLQTNNIPDTSKGTAEYTYTWFDHEINTDYHSSPWFFRWDEIKKVTIKDEIKPRGTVGWFNNFVHITDIEGLSNINMSKCESAKWMFLDCPLITKLDLSTWSTPEIIDTNEMFKGCTGLTEVKFGVGMHFNGAPNIKESRWKNISKNKVYNTSAKLPFENGTFKGAQHAGTYTTNFQDAYAILYDTGEMVFQRGERPDPTKGNAIGTYSGFEYAEIKKKEDVPWNNVRENITTVTFKDVIQPLDVDNWFEKCVNLVSVNNGNNLDLSYCNSASNMFCHCSKLESIDVSTWNMSNITSIYNIFFSCSALSTINVSNWNTSNCIDFTQCFYSCSKLQSLDVSKWNVSNCERFNSMFSQCAIISIDISSWDMCKAKDISYMFSNCDNLEVIDLSKSNISSNCIDASCLFSNSDKLKEVNLMKCNMADNVNTKDMFLNVPLLEKIHIGDGMHFNGDVSIKNAKWNNITTNQSYSNSSSLPFVNGTFNGAQHAGTYVAMPLDKYAILYDTGEMVFQIGDMPDQSKGTVVGSYTGFEDLHITSSKQIPWNDVRQNIITVTFKDVIKPTDAFKWFDECRNLVSVNNGNNLDLSNCNNVDGMFYNCRKLKSIDVSSWNMSNIASLFSMFHFCESLTSLDVSNWDVSNCKDFTQCFRDCDNLTNLDVSNWNVTKAVNLSSIFYGCSNLNSIDVSKWNVSNCSDFAQCFGGCFKLKNIDVSNWNVSNASILSSIFSGCRSLENINISNWDVSNCTDFIQCFAQCTNLKTIDISNWNVSRGENFMSMFNGCTALTSIDISTWDMGKAQNISYMFNDCDNLEIIDLSKSNISSNCIRVSNLFSNSDKLKEVNLMKCNMATNVDTTDMFVNAPSLEKIHIGAGMHFNGKTGILDAGWKNLTTNDIYGNSSQLPFENGTFDGAKHAGVYERCYNANMTITNQISGTFGNQVKDFSFNVEFNGNNIPQSVEYTKGTEKGTLTVQNNCVAFTLKDDESIILNLPIGTEYAVTAIDGIKEGYNVTAINETGIITADTDVSFTLSKEGAVPTSADTNMPEMIFISTIICSATIVIVAFKLSKKTNKKHKK